MPVRREQRASKSVWVIDVLYRHPDGKRERVRRILPSGTKRHAEEYERKLRDSIAEGKHRSEEKDPPKEVPTLAAFSMDFLATYAQTNNKPSEIETKTMIFERHLVPSFGKLHLTEIGVRQIEEYKARKLAEGLSPKTVNNHLTVLRRALHIAVDWSILEKVPPVKWLKTPEPEFDFLSFDEAGRLIQGADPDWRAMIVVGLKAGLRQGEILALRWEDVDLVAGRLHIRQAVARGKVGTPKNGKSRVIEIGEICTQALKAHRHLRGPLVFCNADGKMLTKGKCKHPLWRACRRAGLRQVGWHVLRHTFASHLVMKGAPLKAVQELMGHATIEMTMRYAHLSPDKTGHGSPPG